MMKVLLLLCLFAACVFTSHVHDWERVSQAKDEDQVTFYVALPQHNLDALEKLLYAVSDPTSPKYGKHATKNEIDALINPTKEEHDKVYNFFANAGPSFNVKSLGDSLKVSASVSDLSAVFQAEFSLFEHTPSGHKAIRARTGVTIPKEIESDIVMITNLVSFPIIVKNDKIRPLTKDDIVGKDQPGFFAPSTLRTLYNITGHTQATNKKTTQAALEFTPEGAFSFSDYQLFAQLSRETFFNYTTIVGPFFPGEWGNTESQLDVQLLGTIGSGAQNWFWTVDNGWIYEMAVDVFNAENQPTVLSISYGWPEALTCGNSVVNASCGSGDNAQYIQRANIELQKLGSAGISVITCSQDEGAPSDANIDCSNKTHPVFGIYPGSSPWVTTVSATSAVGANNLLSPHPPPICDAYGCSNTSTEAPCTITNDEFQWTTGGGFSEITAMPPYQSAVVQAYIKSSAMKPPTKFYWPKNRGYPDVSAIGARVLIVSGGAVTVAEGTSASTPIVAGMISLLNDWRFNNGKGALGFLNPMMYQMAAADPKAFKDITTGNNKCSAGTCCEYGYGATTGWDAVTGLGTPNFGHWLAYVQALPQ